MPFSAKGRRGHDRETVGSDFRRAPEAWCFEGVNTGTKCRGMAFPEGDITDPKAQQGYRWVGAVGVGLFSGAARAASYEFSPASEEDSRRETTGSDWHYAPEARCSRSGTLQAQRAEVWCSQEGTLRTQMSNEATNGMPTSFFLPFFERSYGGFSHFSANEQRGPEARNRGFASCSRGLVSRTGTLQFQVPTLPDSSLECSRRKVVLLWQPPSNFSPWFRSSFVCRVRRIIFLSGAVHDDRKDHAS